MLSLIRVCMFFLGSVIDEFKCKKIGPMMTVVRSNVAAKGIATDIVNEILENAMDLATKKSSLTSNNFFTESFHFLQINFNFLIAF